MLRLRNLIFILSIIFICAASAAHAAAITVNTTVDENNIGANCSLREAITAANTDAAFGGCTAGSGTDTITITATGTITIGSSLPNITSSMTVNGPGSASLTVAGNNTFRLLSIGDGFTVNISNLTMANGRANGLQGGAIDSNNSTVAFSNMVFNGNRASFDGGAVRNNGGNMTVTNCTFTSNISDNPSGQGGALKHNGGSLVVTGSTFALNTAAAGGGIHVGTGTVSTTVTNSTFYQNTATFGGGVEMREPATFRNCTFTRNVASSVGGIDILFSPVTLVNTIVSGNLDPNGNPSDVELGSGGTVNLAASFNNLIGSAGATGMTNGSNGNQVNVLDPHLAPLGNYGGPTQTAPPAGASTAINAGTNAGAPATDQRGAARTAGGGSTDIGAVEVNFVVNLTTETVDTTPGDGLCDTSGSAGSQCTLRAAIQEANAFAGTDVISIALPAASTITLGSALPNITTDMAILGTGPVDLTVSGNDSLRNFNINGPAVTIGNMRVASGFSATQGGCIESNGTLTLNDVTVDDCTSNGQGGGVDAVGTLNIVDSTVSNNSALLDGGGISTFGVLTLTNSTVMGNSAPSGQGGGIAVMNGGVNNGSLTAVNSTFSGNTASVTGGAVSFDTPLSNTITNCTIVQNAQTNIGSSGGGIGIPAGTVTLKNTLVWNNTKNGGTQSDITGTVVAASSFNLIGTGGAGGLTNGVNNNQVGVADARLAPLGNYGGKTQTYALSGNSTAINAGTATGAPTTDQRGIARTSVDIGAFEQHVLVTPTSLSAGSVGTNYSQTYSASGGTGDFPNAALTGTLPTGMSFFPLSLALSGTPTQTGTFPICVIITDSNGFSGAICHNLVINAGPLHHFGIAAVSSPQTAGTPFSITISAQDLGNNTVTGFAGSINLTTNGGTISPTTTGAFTAGVRTMNVTLTQAGTLKTISVNDGGGGHTGTSNTFTVDAGALHHFAIGSISGTRTAGTPFNITITAQDLNNNTVTPFTDTVNLTTNSGTINPTVSGAFTAGARTQSVTLTGTGTGRTISVDDGAGHSAASNTFQVVVPTAATVSVAGRVLTPDGRGLVNAVVILTDSRDRSRTAISSAFGYYRFDDVPAGATYSVVVSSKRFRFSPRIVNVADELADLDFIANGSDKLIEAIPIPLKKPDRR